MKDSEQIKIGKLETHIEHILASSVRIEKALKEHIDLEAVHRFEDKAMYAPISLVKSVSRIDDDVIKAEKDIKDMPDKLANRFANIWAETYLKAVTATIGGAAIIFGMNALFSHLNKL